MYQPDLKKAIMFGPRRVPLGECLQKIFLQEVSRGSSLDVMEIRQALDEVSIDYDQKALQTDEDTLSFLKKQPATHLREFMKVLFDARQIAIDEMQFRRLNSKSLVDVFFVLFKVQPEAQAEEQAETKEQEQVVKTTDNQQAKNHVKVSWLSDAKSLNILVQLAKKHKRLVNASDFEADTTDIVLYENLPITKQDGYYLLPGSLQVEPSFVALCDAQGNVSAVGSLEADNGKFYYQFAEDDIDFPAFIDETSFTLIFLPVANKDDFYASLRGNEKNYKGMLYQLACQVEGKEAPRAMRPLCIDFGTSNTTAGSYGIRNAENNNTIEIVKFEDVVDGVTTSKPMFPTVAYVADCSDPQNIRYLFGYEAQRRIQAQDYSTQASIFYEMKRWLNELDVEEEIIDEAGHKTAVKRFAIVKAYLQHVIRLSEKYFKVKFHNLHFSAPVKLKKGYLKRLSTMFPEPAYHVYTAAESLDEGVAIVYHQIMENISSLKVETNDDILIPEENPEDILVLDCGGGTTDLASCSYYAELDSAVHRPRVHIRTGYENGDMNFGGNNVTYRILQMLKIKVAYYQKYQQNIEMSQFIPESEGDILQKIDEDIENGSTAYEKEIYEKFEQAYQEAEKVVPTRFAKTFEPLQKKRIRIKRNYYYLWQMAENIKLEFYKAAADRVTVDFSKEADRRISVGSIHQYHLDINKDDKLVNVEHPLDGLDITINEIERIIRPDIYALLNRLLYIYQDSSSGKNLLDFDFFKMSGQSCNITLFHDLMKEFVPGKHIRRLGGQSEQEKRDELKMSCLSGCIEYCRDRDNDAFEVDLQRLPDQKLLYEVYHERTAQIKELLLGERDGQLQVNLDVNTEDVRQAIFVIEDKWGNIKNTCTYHVVQKQGRDMMITDILQDIIAPKTYLKKKALNQVRDKLYDIDPPEGRSYIALIAVPASDAYGIYIIQLCLTKEEDDSVTCFVQNDGQYFNFEKDETEYFFDGRR